MSEVKKVYAAIAAVTEKLSKEGISKSRKNAQQGYNFRGIDDVYNALAPFLANAKLCILPCVLERELVERQSQKGGALFYVTVKVDFAFVSAEDGSDHHVVTYGEAMDSGDKATNKAMSAAFKYAAMQAFCIPTEGDNDADSQTHVVAPKAAITPTTGVWESMSVDEQTFLTDLSNEVRSFIQSNDVGQAVRHLEAANLGTEERIAIWTRFSSTERSAMKKQAEANKAKVKETA